MVNIGARDMFRMLGIQVLPSPLSDNAAAYTKFNWQDPLDLDSLLTDEEKQIS